MENIRQKIRKIAFLGQFAKKSILIFDSPQIASAKGGQLCNLLKSEEAIFLRNRLSKNIYTYAATYLSNAKLRQKKDPFSRSMVVEVVVVVIAVKIERRCTVVR